MIIEKLEIREFGKFSNQVITFNDAMNCITGDNEAGKTTITLFIRYMLYGIPKQRRKDDFSLRDRIIPFNGNCARGAMIIKKDNRTYRLERYFGKTSKDDSMFLLDDLTKEKILISEEPGEYFLKIKEESFIKLLLIQELNQRINIDGSDEILEKLQNFAITFDERVNSQHAIKLIDEKIKSINNPKNTGELDILEGRNQYIENKLKEIVEAKGKLTALNLAYLNKRTELDGIIEDKNLLIKSRDDINKLRSLENYEEALILINKKKELSDVLSTYYTKDEFSRLGNLCVEFEKIHNKTSILTEEIKSYNEAYKKLSQNNTFLEAHDRNYLNDEKLDYLNNLTKQYEDLNKKINLLSLGSNNEDTDELTSLSKDYLDTLKKINGYKNYKIEIGSLILLVILVIIYIINNSMEILLLALAPLIFIIVLGGYKFYNLKKEKIKSLELLNELRNQTSNTSQEEFIELLSFLNEEGFNVRKNDIKNEIISVSNEIKEIISSSNCRDINEFIEKVHKINEITLENESLEKYLLENSSILSNKKDELTSLLISLEEEIKFFTLEDKPLNLKNIGEVKINLLKKLSKREEFYKNKEEYDRVFNKLDEISKELNLNEIILDPMKYTKDEISKEILKEKEFTDKVESFNKVIQGKKSELDKLKEEINIVENIIKDEVKLYTEFLENKIKIRDYKKDLLSLYLAKENINKIIDRMKREYLPRVSNRVSSIMEQFTKGTYENIHFKEDFSLSYEIDGQTRDFRYLSRGTMDILWVALRLALCDIILSSEKMPIILDDTFIHTDNKRLKNVLEYLKNRADTYQIIILSCHKREEEILNNLG